MPQLTASVDSIDAIVDSIKKLGPGFAAEVAERLSASASTSHNRHGSGLRTFGEVRAAAETNHAVKQQMILVKAMAQRMNVSIPEDKPIDVVTLNRELAGQDVTTRLELKSFMYQLGMLPA